MTQRPTLITLIALFLTSLVFAAPAQADPTTFGVTVRYDARDMLSWYPVAFSPFMGPVIERFAAIPSGGW